MGKGQSSNRQFSKDSGKNGPSLVTGALFLSLNSFVDLAQEPIFRWKSLSKDKRDCESGNLGTRESSTYGGAFCKPTSWKVWVHAVRALSPPRCALWGTCMWECVRAHMCVCVLLHQVTLSPRCSFLSSLLWPGPASSFLYSFNISTPRYVHPIIIALYPSSFLFCSLSSNSSKINFYTFTYFLKKPLLLDFYLPLSPLEFLASIPSLPGPPSCCSWDGGQGGCR